MATAAGTSNNGSGSTIIYCPTQSMVMEVTQYLEQQLNRNNTNANATSDKTMMMKVQSYHGGQSMNHRSEAHINFLTGRTQIIVATLAFGMGIGALVLFMCIYFFFFGCIFRCS
jgi:superfamily II DNA helicase RecQ